VVLSCRPDNLSALENDLKAAGQPYTIIGKVTAPQLMIDGEYFGNTEEFKADYETAIEKVMEA
jgi:hypothetical protein